MTKIMIRVLIILFAAQLFGQVPASNHVFIVMEENTNYSNVTSTSMPYLTGLAAKYGLATQYYANTHPSIGNYLMLTTGQILTNDDSQTPSSFPVSEDNVVRHLLTAGKTWKAYEESLPNPCYLGGNTGEYAVRHNPLAYMTDVQNSSVQCRNIVPFTQFATDLANNQLSNYSFITPNLCDDAHDCSLSTADKWLQANIAPLIASATFQTDGILVITFDESGSDNTNGGGRVYWVVVSPMAKKGYQSTTLYQHQSTLRMMMAALGLTSFPGAAATAPQMGEFFVSTTPTVSVSISPTTATIASGGTQQFTAGISGSTNTAVTWTTSLGKVSSTGLYTAPTVSTNTMATVIATSQADTTKSASATVSIMAPPPAVSVSISPVSATVGSGATQRFTATVSNTTNTAVTWSSTIGTVSTTGLFTAPTVTLNTIGTVTATSSADPTKSATATTSVTPIASALPGFSLNVTPTSQTVARGSSSTYTLTVADLGGFNGPVTFAVSGLGGGATVSFSPASVTGSGLSDMTITTGKGRTGNFNLAITASSGVTTHTSSVLLTITK